eukprot:TRINITY_DN6215_c0_g1_i2.p1 TRINITY_DN6215_c0_g1~~TRINITY_DN6215_c0_g1_i2.p1  ORF type:complete len:305 (+),score=20.04 TRINITY_DN6215_c0_g1_i2:258-1172(+)
MVDYTTGLNTGTSSFAISVADCGSSNYTSLFSCNYIMSCSSRKGVSVVCSAALGSTIQNDSAVNSGSTAGAVVGAVLGVCCLTGILVVVWRRRRKSRVTNMFLEQAPQDEDKMSTLTSLASRRQAPGNIYEAFSRHGSSRASHNNHRKSRQEKPDIFISLRYGEALPAAEALKAKLEEQGASVFLCSINAGGDLMKHIATNLSECRLAVILGTRTYGKDTGVGFSTYEELHFIQTEKKPKFLVKMCDKFEEATVRFVFGAHIKYYLWQPQSEAEQRQVPEDLVDEIIDKLADLGKIVNGLEISL